MIKINPSILSKTVKAITPKTEKVEEAQIRGTIVYRNQEHFVQLDGAPSDALTPIAEFAEGASDAGFVHGDRVLVLIKNHQAIVTKNLTTGLQAQAAKEASAFTTAITDEGITAQRIIANDTFTNTLRANHITADEIIAGMATIDTLDANYAHITDGVIDNAKIGVADVNDLSANYAHITTGVIDNAKIDVADVNNLSANYAHITNGVIDNAKIGYADVNNLSANYAQINAANVTDLSAQNAWVNKIMVQTGLIAHESNIFTLDAIQVNAANITAGTIDVNRLIVTVDGEKYLVEIDPTTHQPSYEKLDGGIVEPRTITADKIVAHDITVQEITTENLVGTNGWINLNQGKFFYGNGASYTASTNAIDWNGTTLKIKGDIGDSVIFNNYSTTTEMNTAIGNAVDGIEVGGNNLLLNSEHFNENTTPYKNSNATRYSATYGNEPYVYCSGAKYIQIDFPELIIGESYILSFEAIRPDAQPVFVTCGEETTNVGRTNSTTIWKRFVYKFTANASTTNAKVRVNNADPDGRDDYILAFRQFQLEKGNAATAWNPSPSETKSTHTLTALNTSGTTYANLLNHAQEGNVTDWNVTSTSGVRIGDTVRVAYKATDMGTDGTIVYVLGTVTAINSDINLVMTSHGLDTTVIDGGHILTGTIDANKVNINTLNVSSSSGWNGMLNSNIQIGGRNLLVGTRNSINLATMANQSWFSPKIYKLSSYADNAITDESNVYITISFDYSITDVDTAFELTASLKTTSSSWNQGVTVAQIPTGNSSGHAVGTRSITSSMRQYAPTNGIILSGSGNANANAKLTVSNFKLEFGNKQTDWSPAPEDTKELHTVQRSYGSTYAQIKGFASLDPCTWSTIVDTTGVQVGDTCRIAIPVTDMSGVTAYITGTVTSVGSSTNLTMTGQSISSTTIDGGMILTGKVGANYIDVDNITIGQSQVTNLSTDLNSIKAQYGYTDTAAGTAAKVVVLANYVDRVGAIIGVQFANGNTVSPITLNVNGTGAKTVQSVDPINDLPAATTCNFIRDEYGQWRYLGSDASSRVSKVYASALSSAKQISTYTRSFTKANWDTYGANGHTESWSASSSSGFDNTHISVGDKAYLTGHVSDKAGWHAAILGTVTSVSTTAVVMTSIKVLYNSAQTEKYVTKIDESGILISPSGNKPSASAPQNSIKIDGNGLNVYKGGVSVASYGDYARVGKENLQRVETKSDGVYIYNGSNAQYGYFGTFARIGDYSGSNVKMDSNGVNINTSRDDSVAFYGASTRIGKANSKRIELDSSSFAVVESNGIAQFSVDATSDSLSRSYTRYLDLTGGGFIAYARFVAPGIGSSIKVGAATAILNVKNAITTTLTLPTSMNATTTVTANGVTFAVTKEGKYVYELNASAASGTNYYAGFTYTTTYREALVSVNDSLVNTQQHLYVPVYTSVGTLDDCTITTWGRIAQIRLEVHKSSVSSGSNVFEGILSDFIPIDDALICGYYGGHACPGKIDSGGGITVRNAGSSSVSPTASSPLIVLGTYIFDPTRTAW